MQFEIMTPYWDRITTSEREDLIRQALGVLRHV